MDPRPLGEKDDSSREGGADDASESSIYNGNTNDLMYYCTPEDDSNQYDYEEEEEDEEEEVGIPENGDDDCDNDDESDTEDAEDEDALGVGASFIDKRHVHFAGTVSGSSHPQGNKVNKATTFADDTASTETTSTSNSDYEHVVGETNSSPSSTQDYGYDEEIKPSASAPPTERFQQSAQRQSLKRTISRRGAIGFSGMYIMSARTAAAVNASDKGGTRPDTPPASTGVSDTGGPQPEYQDSMGCYYSTHDPSSGACGDSSSSLSLSMHSYLQQSPRKRCRVKRQQSSSSRPANLNGASTQAAAAVAEASFMLQNCTMVDTADFDDDHSDANVGMSMSSHHQSFAEGSMSNGASAHDLEEGGETSEDESFCRRAVRRQRTNESLSILSATSSCASFAENDISTNALMVMRNSLQAENEKVEA